MQMLNIWCGADCVVYGGSEHADHPGAGLFVVIGLSLSLSFFLLSTCPLAGTLIWVLVMVVTSVLR